MDAADRAQLELFLADIRAEPEDDTVRLVLADWLQDRGDPRGELMAVQIRQTILPFDDPAREELRRHEMRLLSRHALDWLGDMADVATEWAFVRGFVHLTATADRLTRWCADHDFAETYPFVEGLHVHHFGRRHLGRLSGVPAWHDAISLRRLSSLEASHVGGSYKTIGGLLAAPGVAGLRRLVLRGIGLGRASVGVLCRAEELSSLRELDLSSNRIGDEAAVMLAECPHLRGLRRLDLRHNPINLEGSESLRDVFGDGVLMGGR